MNPSNSEDVDCQAVLADLYAFLDGEMTQAQLDRINAHLQACPPCLDERDVEMALRAVVRRSCACEPAPERLRASIIASITTVRVRLDG